MKHVAFTPSGRGLWPVLGVVLGLLLAGCSGEADKNSGPQWVSFPDQVKGIAVTAPRPLESFDLVDQEGKVFNKARVQGQWSLLFFGYTYCPDVCPTSLTLLAEMFDVMAEQNMADDYQGVFVSVDPKRDTVSLLKEYTAYFHPKIIGVTGQDKAIASVAGLMGALYYREPGRGDEDYLISHSAKLHVINPAGQMVAALPSDKSPDELVALFKTIKTMKIKDAKP
ncbi:SCO family protein [Magnetococcus sp. PR-3]|uniref:SCO family protein n=1 Tax=Magnetococcus sp. PR-3 TaxID=3120355 RepID=UPI002FCE250C